MLDTMSQRPLVTVLIATLLTAVLFNLWDIDLAVAGLFYDMQDNRFIGVSSGFFRVVYDLVTPLTAIVLLGSLGILAYAIYRKKVLLRSYALLVLLTLLIGPGLIVNAIFKDHWQRPRPIQTEQFGGNLEYVSPLIMGDPDGPVARSFPSGHSSAAFALFSLWLVTRRRWPYGARWVLAGALLTGGIVGLARMAAGGHYLSDVLFSAWFTMIPALTLYYLVLAIPQQEHSARVANSPLDVELRGYRRISQLG